MSFESAARVARAAAELILKEGLPDQVLLNVNVPEPWKGGVKFTRQSKKITRNQLTEGKDPRGRIYFWLYEQKIDRGCGAGYGLCGDFCGGGVGDAFASGSDGYEVVEAVGALGESDRDGVWRLISSSADLFIGYSAEKPFQRKQRRTVAIVPRRARQCRAPTG